MKNWKKVMAMLCAAAMVTGSSAPVWAEADAAEDTEAADDEITELTMDMLDEAAYEGTWLSFEPGFDLYVPSNWDVLEISDEDAEYEQVVENATTKTLLFADRFPFRYLLDDYDLNYYAAFPGCSADVEASFYTITFLANKIDQLDLKSIFVIDQTNLKIAQTVKDNTQKKNQKIMYLDSLQSVDDQKIKDGYSYLKAMKYNLKVLKKAL